MPLRLAFDLLTAAALVHAAYPAQRPPAGGRRIAWAGWGIALLLAVLSAGGSLRGAWWWAQGGVMLLGLPRSGC